ncbi:hypothetical protein JCM10450v2_005801 [Rhodotorula kratochvilovae]
MLLPRLSAALVALASLSSGKPVASPSHSTPASATPAPPALKWLYTANVLCPPNVMPNVTSPQGLRKGIPIIGGNVTMFDGSQWTIRDLGDTRYNAYNAAGDDLFFQTSGPGQAAGGLHLRVKIETGSEKYYWLNHVVAVGILKNVGTDAKNVSTLQITVFNFEDDRNATSVAFLD